MSLDRALREGLAELRLANAGQPRFSHRVAFRHERHRAQQGWPYSAESIGTLLKVYVLRAEVG